MKQLFTSLFLLTLLFAVETANAGHFNLAQKSMLEFTLSARDYSSNLNEVDFSNRDSFDNTKFSIGINHWTTENSAMTFSISALDVTDQAYFNDYGIDGTESTIIPIFFGTRIYMNDRNGVMPVKPYIALSGGPILGVNNYKDFGYIVYFEDDVYLTVGGYVGGGIDFMFGKRTTIGMQGGYNFYADFDEYIGDRKNFSGAEIGISLGFLFGHDYDNNQRKKKSKKRVRKF